MDISSILADNSSCPSSSLDQASTLPLQWVKKPRRCSSFRKHLSWTVATVYHTEESQEPEVSLSAEEPFTFDRADSGSLSSSTGLALSDNSSSVSQTPRPSTPSDLSPPTHNSEEQACDEEGEPFPVPLFVTAIGDGEISEQTPPKERERLLQMMRKVPREQQTRVRLCCGSEVLLKLRLFACASEDARTVSAYLAANASQQPAPFVVLCRELPMAALLDGQAPARSDSAGADRVRKQAKTRAVRLLRRALQLPTLGLTRHILRGGEGPWRPEELMGGWLAGQAETRTVRGAPRSVLLFSSRSATTAPPSKRPRAGDISPAASASAAITCTAHDSAAITCTAHDSAAITCTAHDSAS